MDTAIKIDFNGDREPVTVRQLEYLRTRAMSFRCVYCDKRVILYRRLDRPAEFVHNVRNKNCPSRRSKRAGGTVPQSARRAVMWRPTKRASY
jgi:hypothetical protein